MESQNPETPSRIHRPWVEGETCPRLQKELLTFLDHDDVTPDNKAGERRIRPAVLIRKNSHGKGTEKGAQPRPPS
ncbi:MAG: hypothetical protein DWH88_00885 [Planctomycetota bacterium]|nr:MAG: hypothetical protein DWH88_00885 [Planctomycetota bacterium]